MHNPEHKPNQPNQGNPQRNQGNQGNQGQQKTPGTDEMTRGQGSRTVDTDESTGVSDRDIDLQREGNLGNERNRNTTGSNR